jgi:tripartite ATP-independent transporter DctM subunit
MVGWIPGGLGHTNVFASIIFAGMSGAAVADAGGLGLVELKAMKDGGYDDDFSLAVTAASSIIGPIIPPSIPAVLFGVVSGVSVGRLFVAGIIPGLLIGLTEALMVYFYAKRRNYPCDPKPTVKQIAYSCKTAVFPLLTPVIIIGGMMMGVFTPTEAAAVAVLYATVLGLVSRELRAAEIPGILLETARSTIVILFIAGCANIFGYIITTMQIGPITAAWFTANIHSTYLTMFLIFLLLMVMGCFMDSAAAIFILVPVLLPVVKAVGIDPVYFGLVFILTLMLGLITPPVGMVLYVLSNVSGVPFTRIAKATVPYVLVLCVLVLIFIFVPSIVTFLPNLVFG